MTGGQLWTMIAVLAGVAFAIEAIVGVPGIVYASTAVVVGAAYTIVTSLTRTAGTGRERNRDRHRDRPAG